MGLICSHTLGCGIEIPSAYFRVGELTYRKPQGSETAQYSTRLEVYASKDLYLAGRSMIGCVYHSLPLDLSDNLVEQAYVAIKTLPEMEGAQDDL